MSKILQVENLVQEFNLTKDFLDKVKFKNGHFSLENRVVHAVNNVSFDGEEGEVFSLVGESGCGKSTTARTIIKLIEPKSGKIIFDGRDITRLKPQEMRPIRREMQMIFQDPYASLNPRQKIMEILTDPMLFHKLCSSKAEAQEKAIHLLERVGLSSEQANRYPHQFSGGQRQRIGIARALAVEPKFIIADEPVSALDVSIQAQILNILMDLKDEFHFSYLFIAHDLSVVKHISDSLGVMYLGTIVERAPKRLLFSNPVLGVLAGALLTAIIQSSSASVGILQALCSTGAVTYGISIPIIMGQNIGTCVTAHGHGASVFQHHRLHRAAHPVLWRKRHLPFRVYRSADHRAGHCRHPHGLQPALYPDPAAVRARAGKAGLPDRARRRRGRGDSDAQ